MREQIFQNHKSKQETFQSFLVKITGIVQEINNRYTINNIRYALGQPNYNVLLQSIELRLYTAKIVAEQISGCITLLQSISEKAFDNINIDPTRLFNDQTITSEEIAQYLRVFENRRPQIIERSLGSSISSSPIPHLQFVSADVHDGKFFNNTLCSQYKLGEHNLEFQHYKWPIPVLFEPDTYEVSDQGVFMNPKTEIDAQDVSSKLLEQDRIAARYANMDLQTVLKRQGAEFNPFPPAVWVRAVTAVPVTDVCDYYILPKIIIPENTGSYFAYISIGGKLYRSGSIISNDFTFRQIPNFVDEQGNKLQFQANSMGSKRVESTEQAIMDVDQAQNSALSEFITLFLVPAKKVDKLSYDLPPYQDNRGGGLQKTMGLIRGHTTSSAAIVGRTGQNYSNLSINGFESDSSRPPFVFLIRCMAYNC